MSSFFLFSMALFAYFSIYIKTRDSLSPTGVFCLFWFIAAAIADIQQFKDSSLQTPWVLETYIAILGCGLIVFLVGLIFSIKLPQAPIYLRTSNKYKIVFNALAILSILAVVLRIYLYGYDFSKLLLSFSGLDLKNELPDAIPFVHYFEILTPFIALCALFELNTSTNLFFKRKFLLIAYVIYAVLFYSLIFSASRGTFLIILTGAVYLYGRVGLIKLIHIIAVQIIIVILMSLLSFIRISAETLSNSYLGDKAFQLFFSPIYTYVAFNFENLNTLIKSNNDPTYFLYSLKFLLWPFLKNEYESGLIKLINFDTLFFNARTIIYPFYHDLGLLGCIIFPGLIATALVWVNNKSKKDPSFIILLMGLQKPILFSFFGNYFFGELILFVPFIVIYILGRMYRKRLFVKQFSGSSSIAIDQYSLLDMFKSKNKLEK